MCWLMQMESPSGVHVQSSPQILAPRSSEWRAKWSPARQNPNGHPGGVAVCNGQEAGSSDHSIQGPDHQVRGHGKDHRTNPEGKYECTEEQFVLDDLMKAFHNRPPPLRSSMVATPAACERCPTARGSTRTKQGRCHQGLGRTTGSCLGESMSAAGHGCP
jgi:hypothetical protein